MGMSKDVRSHSYFQKNITDMFTLFKVLYHARKQGM